MLRVFLFVCVVVANHHTASHALPTDNTPTNEQIVIDHVRAAASQTFRNASGYLKFPYLVPAGPYNQLWDWDSVFMGVGLLEFGSAPYLAGSMLNFLSQTNITDGDVKGCLTPDGATPTLYHAKPVIIQGAWLAAMATNNTEQFRPYAAQMKALLDYWDRERLDEDTGLYVWHDQLETGADNLPISTCPSPLSDCWNATIHALAISSSDVMTLLFREHQAFSLFTQAWEKTASKRNFDLSGQNSTSLHLMRRASLSKMQSIRNALDKYLFNPVSGVYDAYNRTARAAVDNRVYLMAFPLFGGEDLCTHQQAASATRGDDPTGLGGVLAADMLSEFGIQSTSSLDPRYNNDNIITPYSNWRGPVWVVANVVLAYSLQRFGFTQQAWDVGNRIVNTTANDLIATSTWHECYSAVNGSGLAAPGFLSWNTLAATVLENLRHGRDPFRLAASA